MRTEILSKVLQIFLIVLILGIFVVAGRAEDYKMPSSSMEAAQALPRGGNSFETAVKIKPGSYQRGVLEENEYFCVAGIKPGQEINIKYTFGAGTGKHGWGNLSLYDEDRTILFGHFDMVGKGGSKSITVSWLPNTDKDSYKYYIHTGYSDYDVGPVSFDISLTNYYDAGSQTDAGGTFEKAMSITAGNYKAYLSGEEAGTDTKDFYKMAVKKGEMLTVKVVPPSEASPSLKIYNSDRVIIKQVFAPNPGAIVRASLTAKKSEKIFVAVLCDGCGSKNVAEYSLGITIQPPPEEEVVLPEEEITLPEEGVPSGEAPEPIAPKEAKEVAKAVGKGIAVRIILWIVFSLVLLIIIGVVVYSLLKKKT